MKGVTIPTDKRKRLFLRALRNGSTCAGAAALAGVARTTPYEWRKNDPAFAKEWARVEDLAFAELEQRAWKRAKSGESDTMTIFLLKTRGPECYRQGMRVEVRGSVNLEHSVTGEAAALLDALAERIKGLPEPPETIEGEAEEVAEDAAPSLETVCSGLMARIGTVGGDDEDGAG